MPITDPCVVRLLAQGGSIDIFGHKEPDGSWSFVGRGSSLELDDDGNDSVTTSGIPRFKDLAEGLPPQWLVFTPRLVHPELRDWFRDRYDAVVSSLPQHRRESHKEFRDGNWRALFYSTPPDRWSEEDEP